MTSRGGSKSLFHDHPGPRSNQALSERLGQKNGRQFFCLLYSDSCMESGGRLLASRAAKRVASRLTSRRAAVCAYAPVARVTNSNLNRRLDFPCIPPIWRRLSENLTLFPKAICACGDGRSTGHPKSPISAQAWHYCLDSRHDLLGTPQMAEKVSAASVKSSISGG